MYAICASCNNYIQFTAADVVFPDFRPVLPPLHLLSGGAVLKGVGFVSFREASSLDRATADMLPFKILWGAGEPPKQLPGAWLVSV